MGKMRAEEWLQSQISLEEEPPNGFLAENFLSVFSSGRLQQIRIVTLHTSTATTAAWDRAANRLGPSSQALRTGTFRPL